MYWYDLKSFDADMLCDARLQTHYALQWLGRVARAYGDNVNLTWDDSLRSLVTDDMPGGVSIALRIEDLSLLTLSGGQVDMRLSLDGVGDDSAGEWICEQIEASGCDAALLMEPLSYELPKHPIQEGAAYDPISGGRSFSELVHWLSNGQAALSDLCSSVGSYGVKPSLISCCPDRFSLSTVINVEAERQIHVGLSPGDDVHHEPYFYVSPRPGLEPVGLPDFIDIGAWQMNRSVARGAIDAVAPASHFVGEDLQAKYVREFLDRAVMIGRERLAA